MNLFRTIQDIDDEQIFYEAQVLMAQCDCYQKELAMRIYLEMDGEQPSPPIENKQTNPQPMKEQPQNNENNPSFFQKIIDTVKKIFMFIPNLITQCIEKIVDKHIAESKQQMLNIQNMSDQDVNALLQKIEQRKAQSSGNDGQQPTEEFYVNDYRSFEDVYQELGTVIGAGMGIKGAREAASNEIARQKAVASASGQQLSDAELAKRSTIGAIEPAVKKAVSIAGKGAAVAGVAALGGSGLAITGVGLLTGIGIGKIWDLVSNSIKDARDKSRIKQLPEYGMIEKAFKFKDKELDDKLKMLETGIPKPDPNVPKPNIKQVLQNIINNFSVVADKETENTIRVINLFYDKYIKPNPALNATQQQPQTQNPQQIDDNILLECQNFITEMNDKTFRPLLQDMKQKSERLVTWFNDGTNPLFGIMTSKQYATKIAREARAEKGIYEASDDKELPALAQKLLGLITSLGKIILNVINIIFKIIRIGGDAIQTVSNSIKQL